MRPKKGEAPESQSAYNLLKSKSVLKQAFNNIKIILIRSCLYSLQVSPYNDDLAQSPVAYDDLAQSPIAYDTLFPSPQGGGDRCTGITTDAPSAGCTAGCNTQPLIFNHKGACGCDPHYPAFYLEGKGDGVAAKGKKEGRRDKSGAFSLKASGVGSNNTSACGEGQECSCKLYPSLMPFDLFSEDKADALIDKLHSELTDKNFSFVPRLSLPFIDPLVSRDLLRNTKKKNMRQHLPNKVEEESHPNSTSWRRGRDKAAGDPLNLKSGKAKRGDIESECERVQEIDLYNICFFLPSHISYYDFLSFSTPLFYSALYPRYGKRGLDGPATKRSAGASVNFEDRASFSNTLAPCTAVCGTVGNLQESSVHKESIGASSTEFMKRNKRNERLRGLCDTGSYHFNLISDINNRLLNLYEPSFRQFLSNNDSSAEDVKNYYTINLAPNKNIKELIVMEAIKIVLEFFFEPDFNPLSSTSRGPHEARSVKKESRREENGEVISYQQDPSLPSLALADDQDPSIPSLALADDQEGGYEYKRQVFPPQAPKGRGQVNTALYHRNINSALSSISY